MTNKSSLSIDIVFSLTTLVLVGVVVGHLFLDDLLMGVQWFARAVAGPIFGLDEHF